MSNLDSYTIVLYDGVCGLCNRLNQFLIKRDSHDRFRFASLQSDFSQSLLKKHGEDAEDLDTVWVVIDYDLPSERLLARSDAILHLLKTLGGFWKITMPGRLLPKFIRDPLYNLVARNRYRTFGKYDTCLMPDEKNRKKFLAV